MITIEERADIYVGHSFEIDEFTSATIKRQAFIDGAKEQRKIDIDKAWQWIKNNQYPIWLYGANSCENSFREAMEE